MRRTCVPADRADWPGQRSPPALQPSAGPRRPADDADGSAGIGKTTLALAVAARLQPHYRDGAVFVPLAAVGDATTMALTIGAAVGSLDAGPKAPQTRLVEHLRHKQMLLVLDNLEQIRDVAPLVAALVAECPGLCILATSRERLHLRAEQRCKVPPLDLAPAVDLFVQRAQAMDAGFRRTPQNQATLEAICLRLDCLPLALELCAAQVDLLSPSQLLRACIPTAWICW